MNYTLYSNSPSTSPPKCSVNSGLYTTPQSNGWWKGICHTPESDYYMSRVEHKDSEIPELYLHHPTTHRPGNNLTKLPGIVKYSTLTGNQNNIQLIENVDLVQPKNNQTNVFNNFNNAYVNLSTF